MANPNTKEEIHIFADHALMEEFVRHNYSIKDTNYKDTNPSTQVDSGLYKSTNPKDSVGTKKAPMSTVSSPAMMEVGLAMLEGARKYGRHNYRVAGISASVYYDALFRHMMAWWEGEDIDPDSGLSHVTKAIATLMVLRDAMIYDKFNDDRPPKMSEGWIKHLNEKAAAIIEKYPDAVAAHTQIGKE